MERNIRSSYLSLNLTYGEMMFPRPLSQNDTHREKKKYYYISYAQAGLASASSSVRQLSLHLPSLLGFPLN